MDGLKSIPIYKRFGFQLLLINGLLIAAILIPTLALQKIDYKMTVDRHRFFQALFKYAAGEFDQTSSRDWEELSGSLPKVFFQQRILIFGPKNDLEYDSGILKEFDAEFRLPLVIPSPYIDWRDANGNVDPEPLVTYLKRLDIGQAAAARSYGTVRTIEYDEGLDRVHLVAKPIVSPDGNKHIFVMSHSIVDILIHRRSIKERILVIYAGVTCFALILSFLASRLATRPLKRLYRYSADVVTKGILATPPGNLPQSGEIGMICKTMSDMISRQRSRIEEFRRFSSDVVHELRTPLTAIRSGIEVYADSADGESRRKVYGRIHRRISQMENLMNEIREIGTLESRKNNECCADVTGVAEAVISEYGESEIELEYSDETRGLRIPLSCDRLSQVLANLVRNAVSFSPVKRSVSVKMLIEGGTLIFVIRDHGPGIRDDTFYQITDRFFSYRPDSDDRHSGLGLSIVDIILKGCGGTLTYRNSDTGAEFIAGIPLTT